MMELIEQCERTGAPDVVQMDDAPSRSLREPDVTIGEHDPDSASEVTQAEEVDITVIGDDLEARDADWPARQEEDDQAAGLSVGSVVLNEAVDESSSGSRSDESAESVTVPDTTHDEPAEETPARAAGSGTPPAQPPGGTPPPAGDFGDDSERGADLERIRHVNDPQLAELLTASLDAMEAPALDRILEATERLNESPFTATDRAQDPHYAYKKILEGIPEFAKTVDAAGIPQAQAADLLAHAFDTVRVPTVDHDRFIAPNLGHALAALAQTGEVVTEQHIVDLKQLITSAGQDGVISLSLSSFAAGCKAGLSPEDSAKLVRGFVDTETSVYAFMAMRHFRNALRALDSAGANPETIKEVFENVQGRRPADRGATYDEITRAVSFGPAIRNRSPAEVVEGINDILKEQPLETDDRPVPPHGSPFALPGQRDTYFREVPGPLEVRATAYQTERSWADGIRDIERLTEADMRRGEAVSEGHWVFDGAANRWYSHGGQTTEVEVGHIVHEAPLYDVSELSRNPVSIHCHPTHFMQGPDRFGAVFPTGADLQAVAALLEGAAVDVSSMRSLIAHPLGITEFRYPQDPAAIRQVAATFDADRLIFFSQFRDWRIVADAVGADEFADASVHEVNQLLPPGFEIKFYPRGTLPEEME